MSNAYMSLMYEKEINELNDKLQEIEKLCGNPDEIHSAGYVIATAVMSIVNGVAANETN